MSKRSWANKTVATEKENKNEKKAAAVGANKHQEYVAYKGYGMQNLLSIWYVCDAVVEKRTKNLVRLRSGTHFWTSSELLL